MRRSQTILRRLRTIPLFVLAFVVVTAAAPLLLVIGVVVDLVRWLRTRTPWMSIRITVFGWLFLFYGLVGLVALTLSWIVTGGGRSSERLLSQAYTIQGRWVAAVLGTARTLFALRFHVEGDDAASPGPIVVLSRHASIVDTLLPAWFIVRPHGIKLRYVLKKELLADPVLDVGGLRLPNHFVDRAATNPRVELRKLGELADGLGADEGILIFPEGTRFTTERRLQAIERMSRPADRERAGRLEHLLTPRPGGTTTLLDAADGADVVMFAHRGLEGLAKVKDVWNGGMVRKDVHVKMWRIPRADVPATRSERIEWLYEQWEAIDAWIAERVSQEERT